MVPVVRLKQKAPNCPFCMTPTEVEMEGKVQPCGHPVTSYSCPSCPTTITKEEVCEDDYDE